MPIKLPNNLPAVKTLSEENVFVMTDTRAITQDIRPLQILILNLMPTKIDTETQLTRLLGNTPLQVELDLLQTSTHKSQNTPQEHMIAFYKTFNSVKAKYYDGMVITGAPVELLDFEDVEYWDELCEIMEWSKTHVHSTFHICWGAQAGLYYHYGIKKVQMAKKLSGVYEHHLDYNRGMLFRGFDDIFYVPHSRYTTTNREDVENRPELQIIASSDEAGVYAIKSDNDRQIFIMGHSEYDGDTLLKEYLRDKEAGKNPPVPEHYFPNDDDTQKPYVRWRSCANLLYSNWLNYFVYQSTPYDINRINEEDLGNIFNEQNVELKVAKFGGSSLADGAKFENVVNIIKEEDERRYIVVSAPGKRKAGDQKVTDILNDYAENGDEDCMIKAITRYREIIRRLGIEFDLDSELEDIISEYNASKSEAYLISRGEYLCAMIMAETLGYDFVDAADTIIFDSSGRLDRNATCEAIRKSLAGRKNVVVPGYYGSDRDGNIVLFSRDGSDITGSLVASAVSADVYENWTDVRGVLMADPSVVNEPLTVPIITYKEARELSTAGSRVLHKDAIIPAAEKNIPINIRFVSSPNDQGTLIVENADYYNDPLEISGVSGSSGFIGVIVEKRKMGENDSSRAETMAYMKRRGVMPGHVIFAPDSLTLIVKKDDIDVDREKIKSDLKVLSGADRVSFTDELALIAVVGRKMSESPAVAVRVLSALAARRINLNLIDHSPEGMSMLLGVSHKDMEETILAIYEEFTKK